MPVISRNERRMVSRYENLDTTQTYSGSGTCERSSRMREQQTVFSHTHWHTLTEVHSHRHTLTFKRWTMQLHRKTETCTDTLTFRHTNTGILRHLHSDTDTLSQIGTHSLQLCAKTGVLKRIMCNAYKCNIAHSICVALYSSELWPIYALCLQ